jgi:hypothetical protein
VTGTSGALGAAVVVVAGADAAVVGAEDGAGAPGDADWFWEV